MADESCDFHFVNEVVMPGDIVGKTKNEEKNKDKKRRLKLGPGLKIDKENIVAYKCGVLRQKDRKLYWVDTDQKRVLDFFYSLHDLKWSINYSIERLKYFVVCHNCYILEQDCVLQINIKIKMYKCQSVLTVFFKIWLYDTFQEAY